ncbi:hypothetical protein OIU79_013466 [Salix purpurea]|uniref:Uncharacterized protein n=1 Tax=Salix purpurea TaxID=77065 RepID=A0A9Q0Q5G6_SALPP|nr:hypothetical protein OIU79_013466 [Salix purpurea]
MEQLLGLASHPLKSPAPLPFSRIVFPDAAISQIDEVTQRKLQMKILNDYAKLNSAGTFSGSSIFIRGYPECIGFSSWKLQNKIRDGNASQVLLGNIWLVRETRPPKSVYSGHQP